jgi:hypothetical protein
VLPHYFLALNKDFTYLTTPIGHPMPNLHFSRRVAPKLLGLFGQPVVKIAGGYPNAQQRLMLESTVPVRILRWVT